MKIKRVALLLALYCLFFSSPLLAEVPSRDTAGSEEARFNRDRLLKEQKKLLDSKETEPVPAPETAPAAADSGEKFPVQTVRFIGNYSIPSAELEPFVQDLIGNSVSLSQIDQAVSAIKEHYRSKGYIAVYCYVPPQRMEDGVLKIDILEGRLGKIKIKGERKWFSDSTLRGVLRAKEGEVLTYNALRKDIAELGKNRDLETKALLEPGESPGTTDVVLEVQEKFPVHLSGEVNNFGTQTTGKYRYGMTAEHTNLTGAMDHLSATAQFGKHAFATGASYSRPLIPAWGTKAGYSFSFADIDVQGSFAPLLVSGDARTHGVSVVQPVYETENLNIELEADFDSKSIQNYLLGNPSSKEELRIITGGVNLDETDSTGRTFSTHDLSVGLPNFAGSSDPVDSNMSRTGTGGEFKIYRGTLVRLQKITDDILFSFRGNLQLTPDALPPSEQISLGGSQTVRGYQEGEYLGDRGGYAAMDLYFSMPFVPDDWKLPMATESLRKQVQLVTFGDVGKGTIKLPLAGEKRFRYLAGAGAGLRVHLYEKVYGRVEWAFPLGDRPFDNRDSAVYFTLSVEAF